MKNNFDFIKQKFENDDIKAPEHINSDFVMSKIEDKSPKRIKFPAKRIAGAVSGLVACLVVVAVATSTTPTPKVVTPEPVVAEASELKTFESYDELKKTLKDMDVSTELEKNINAVSNSIFSNITYKYEGTADSAISMEESSFAETYTQVDGVDEADIVKTDGKYIYYVSYNSDSKLKIYSAKGTNSKCVASIPIKSSKTDYCIEDFYLNNNKVIINAFDYSYQKTFSFIYDISDINDIKKIDTFSQSGYYVSSRMIGDELYIVSNQYIETRNDVPYITCKDSTAALNPKCISCVENPTQPEYLVISRINTSNGTSDTETKAILGASNDLYCNKSNMYILSTIWENDETDESVTVESVSNDFVYSISDEKTHIIKVNLDNGIKFTSTAKVNGYIKDQYSLDEKNGFLRIATTSQNNSGEDINNLYVLNGNLKVVGKVEGFAPTESIKAVKYIGNTAYVITYEQTDPLFVIDLSNPTKPEILGECKIDGFSTMLVPVGDDKLLGIGYYTEEGDYTDMEVRNGIKLALFDISNKTKPTVVDEQVFKGYNSSAQYNPKAFIFNPQKQMYIIPFNDEYGKTGGLAFQINNSSFDNVNKYIINTDYDECMRCTYVDDDLYMLTSSDEIFSSPLK